jgi:long-chain fatty acid transport protein
VRTALVFALLTALVPTGARASGIAVPLVGTPWAGVTTADPAAVHWNPAMLSMLSGYRLEFDGAIAYGHGRYRRERRAEYQVEDGFQFALPLDPEEVDATKTGFAEPIEFDLVLPVGSLFASFELHERLRFGFGAYGVAGVSGLKLPDDGPQKWQVQEASILAVHLTPSVGIKLTEWLHVGAGVNLVVGLLSLRQVVDLAGTPLLGDVLANDPINQPNDFGPDAPSGVRELDVLSRQATILHGVAVTASFNLGVAIQPVPELTLGLAYQHFSNLVFKADAYLDMNHDFFTTDLASQGLQYPPLVKGDAYIEMPIPWSLRAAVAWRVIPELELTLQGSVVGWSMQETLRVTLDSPDLAQPELGVGSTTTIDLPRRWLDTVEVELLATIQATTDLRLGIRAGYHSPASPDSTVDLASIDGHRLVFAIMGDLQVSAAVNLGLFALLNQILPRRVVSSDYDRGNGEYLLTLVAGGGAIKLGF